MSERDAGWLGPIAVSLFAFCLRAWHLAQPRTLSFDERYYAENAWSMLHFGYAQDFLPGAEEKIAAGNLTGLMIAGQPTQVVHPDAAKWLIAAGEAVFGMNSFGWRIASAVVGALTVLVLARLVLRLTHSAAFACIAGFLVAIDGVHLTLSRLALLDVFVTFWIVCAVACLVVDRDWIATRLPETHRWRPWQLAAGVCFGLACGSKWNGIYALAVFGVAAVAWELVLRRPRGAATALRTTLDVGVPAFLRLVGVAAVVYVLTCAGWLANHEVYEARFGHTYGDEPAWGAYVERKPSGPLESSTDALRSLWKYQGMSYRFHTGDYLAGRTHPYESEAIWWPTQLRPVVAAWESHLPPDGCGAEFYSECVRETVILGNPAVWWPGIAAVLVSAVAWVRTRQWQYSVPILGVVATWVPWLPILDRPIFSFYAVTTLPFLVIALALSWQATWKAADTVRRRRQAGLAIGALLGLAAGCAVYFWPIWTNGQISYDAWRQRMWVQTWIRGDLPLIPARTGPTQTGPAQTGPAQTWPTQPGTTQTSVQTWPTPTASVTP